MTLLNVGARALLANQVALQTAGHNIANVNTAGYSRQNVVLQTVQGQFTGGGYIGKGVNVQTILRSHSELLTRQASAASAVEAGDAARVERLRQLQDVFTGGESGIGASINDMLNALSDVVSTPTDLTARSVALTRMDETATRVRDASQRLDEISYTLAEELKGSANAINSLATNIAGVNDQIARAKGNGQPPNDLLDQRDQLIRELNQHIQTTQVAADDGSVSVFVAGSQPLVLGNKAASMSVGDPADFGASSGQKVLTFQQPGSAIKVVLNESMLGGGKMAGLLRFQNSDLAEGRNLLGRMAIAISHSLNEQNQLGLTLDGQPGQALFEPARLTNAISGTQNVSGATLGAEVSDLSKLKASSYTLMFNGAGSGLVIRNADERTFSFADLTELATVMANEGLAINDGTLPPAAPGPFGGAAAGDKFFLNPLETSAGLLKALQYAPSDLAAANRINASMGTANAGRLQLMALQAVGDPASFDPPAFAAPPAPAGGVTLTFAAGPPMTYSATGMTQGGVPVAQAGNYVPGQAITFPQGWSITLQGTPASGDTVTLGNPLAPQAGDWYKRDAGNARALMALRDKEIFDGAKLSDGFASAMAQVGTRAQSAGFSAELSSSIAASLESDRTALSGVNLDEEAARLIQYQQAYQASAKMIQIAQGVFDTLIQSMTR
jgi:flagellar hook-associated protein 1 FlgK